MNNLLKDILGIFVITLFYGLFMIPSFLRIKKAIKEVQLHDSDIKSKVKIKTLMDIIINFLVIVGALVLYLLLLLGILLPK